MKTILSALALISLSCSAWSQELPQTPACQDFYNFATQRVVDPRYISSSRSELAPFKTDTVLVQRDGRVLWSWSDKLYTLENPRVQWSISKMITVTLLGATLAQQTLWAGEPLSLDTKLASLFPSPGPQVSRSPEAFAKYRKITLRDLVEMSAGIEWKEYYDTNVQDSSFLPMLYMPRGFKNMSAFAMDQKFFPEGPGRRWVYSGGNANILIAVLEKVHADRPNFMNELLFEPLGIDSWTLERDQSGHGVGSSYFYLSTKDMTKLGQLFLDRGIAPNGKRILEDSWIEESQQLTPTIFSELTSLEIIKKLGAGSRRLFWLNTDVHRDNKVFYPREFPEAPADMYFAAGHYGQLIVVIPSHQLIITRTGHDASYWDHVQPLVVKALNCFVPGYRPNPVESLVPPSAGTEKDALERSLDSILSLPGQIRTVNFLRHSGVAATVLAKELCSFYFTQELDQAITPKEAIASYKKRSGLPPTAQNLLIRDLDIHVDSSSKEIEVVGALWSPFPWKKVKSAFQGKSQGCSIVRAW